jgi:hypothetical protein
LDPWKSLDDIEKEVEDSANASFNRETKVAIHNALKNIK